MWVEKWRRPSLYTRSKSECFSNRPLRGFVLRRFADGLVAPCEAIECDRLYAILSAAAFRQPVLTLQHPGHRGQRDHGKNGKFIRGIRASPKHVYDLWRAGVTVPALRSWSSCASGIRASLSAYAGWVGK